MDNSYIIVLVTTSNKQEAERISQELLEAKLIACANIVGPVSSHFVWNDKIEQTDEFLIFMKSQMILFEELSERVKALHSYEVPEVLALPIVGGSKAYLDWLGASLK